MQPKPTEVPRALSQHVEMNFSSTASQLSHAPAPLREVTTTFTHRDFAAPKFPVDGFATGDFTAMDFALPDVMDSRVFRLIGAKNGNGAVTPGSRSLYQIGKRVLDVLIASVLLVMASPLLVAIALLVKMTSKGPVFFAHRRLGRHGEEFYCLKFRTMIVNAEESLKRDPELRRQFEERFKLERDPRITPIGGMLRRTSLDELPQLFHVLSGQMSLVGPRPIVRDELTKYSIYATKLTSVKPGLSGLWQVCGRSDTTYPQRVMMDMHYIDHCSFGLDLRLLLLTASAVLRKTGAW
jgi:lipopolysaccharide/colanic/teichoic acid biosynthesis glycosyltransferase